MNRIVIVALALALAPVAQAQLYKYVDKDGKTVYSDQPPPGLDSKTLNLRAPGAAPPKTAVEKDKDLEKARKEVADRAKKAGEAEARAAESEARCAQARQNVQIYADGGRIQKLNEKGERELMTDAEIESKRDSSRREMEEACKGR